jgi:ABC-type antimicrobial peptide transport system permease subunit
MSAEVSALRLQTQAQLTDEPVRGQWALFWRRFRRHKMALISAFVLGFIFIVAAAAPLVAPYNPDKTDLKLTNCRASSTAHGSRWWSAFWRLV